MTLALDRRRNTGMAGRCDGLRRQVSEVLRRRGPILGLGCACLVTLALVTWPAISATAKPRPSTRATKTPAKTPGEELVGEDAGLSEFDGIEHIDVGTRDVLERLKLLRVQMALDMEEISALRLRIEKIRLQRDFEVLLASGKPSTRRRRGANAADILVKAIALRPQKEAVILYRGKIFTVQPGDRIPGGLVIKNITESGLKVRGAGRSGSTTVVR